MALTSDPSKIKKVSGQPLPLSIAQLDENFQELINVINDAESVQVIASGKNKTFYGATTPSADAVGDLWYNQTSQILKRWDGVNWLDISNAYTNTNQLTDGAGLGVTAQWDQITGTGKPSNNATSNSIYHQSTAPSSPIDGDIWADTSTTPSTIKLRVSGAWQLAANFTTDTNQLTDSAGLGTSAIWNDISGAGKPQDNATSNTFYHQSTTPTNPINGDAWADTNTTPATIKLRVSGVWVIAANFTTDTNQLTDSAGLGTSAIWNQVTGTGKPADGATKNTIFRQTTAPTTGMSSGDLWVNTSNGGESISEYNGTAWVSYGDITSNNTAANTSNVGGKTATQVLSDITNAFQTASTAQSTADGKIVTYYQSTTPTGSTVGDIWFDTSNGNKQYRWNGSSWINAQDSSIGTAIQNASTAQSTADGKITTYFSTTSPTADVVGDLWYNDSTKLVKRWNGSTWVDIANSYNNSSQLADGAGWSTTAVWGYISGTGKPADNATKNKIFRQNTAPTSGMSAGDFWVNTNGSGGISEYNGSNWVSYGDITSQNTANDTNNVGGTPANTVKNNAQSGVTANNTVNNWIKPGFSLIDGNKIYTGDAYVDTLQIKGQAITVPAAIRNTNTNPISYVSANPGQTVTIVTMPYNHGYSSTISGILLLDAGMYLPSGYSIDSSATLTLYVGGNNVYQYGFQYDAGNIDLSEKLIVNLPPGAINIELKLYNWGSTGDIWRGYYRSIIVFGSKR